MLYCLLLYLFCQLFRIISFAPVPSIQIPYGTVNLLHGIPPGETPGKNEDILVLDTNNLQIHLTKYTSSLFSFRSKTKLLRSLAQGLFRWNSNCCLVLLVINPLERPQSWLPVLSGLDNRQICISLENTLMRKAVNGKSILVE